MFKSPKVNSIEMQRVIDDIYKSINELGKKIPESTSQVKDLAKEPESAIKVQKKDDGNFELTVKTNEGFVSTNLTIKE